MLLALYLRGEISCWQNHERPKPAHDAGGKALADGECIRERLAAACGGAHAQVVVLAAACHLSQNVHILKLIMSTSMPGRRLKIIT